MTINDLKYSSDEEKYQLPNNNILPSKLDQIK